MYRVLLQCKSTQACNWNRVSGTANLWYVFWCYLQSNFIFGLSLKLKMLIRCEKWSETYKTIKSVIPNRWSHSCVPYFLFFYYFNPYYYFIYNLTVEMEQVCVNNYVFIAELYATLNWLDWSVWKWRKDSWWTLRDLLLSYCKLL